MIDNEDTINEDTDHDEVKEDENSEDNFGYLGDDIFPELAGTSQEEREELD